MANHVEQRSQESTWWLGEHPDRLLAGVYPRMLVLDFDGVLTDNRVEVDQNGTETVRCSKLDSQGVSLLNNNGFPVVVLSSERNDVVARRSEKMKVPAIYGVADKTVAFRELASDRACDHQSIIFVGNDVNDIGCLQAAGRGLVVADAHPLAIAAADAVLSRRGGDGAVREVCDAILHRLGFDLHINPSDAINIRSA